MLDEIVEHCVCFVKVRLINFLKEIHEIYFLSEFQAKDPIKSLTLQNIFKSNSIDCSKAFHLFRNIEIINLLLCCINE